MFTYDDAFDEMRKALIEKNIALNCGYETEPIDYEYIYNKCTELPTHHELHNEIDNYEGMKMEINLNITFLIDAYLSAFANLSLAARLRYTMILLYCSDTKKCLENDQIGLDDLGFLYAAKLVELPDTGMIVTTKEGMIFLHRFFNTNDLKQEFK